MFAILGSIGSWFFWCAVTPFKLILGKGALVVVPVGVGANVAIAEWWQPENYAWDNLHWFVAGWGTCCFLFLILYRTQQRVKKAVT